MKIVLHEMQFGKRLLGLLSMLAIAVLSWGDNIKVSMADFSIMPGETQQVAIDVTSDVECGSAFQGIIELPAGLTIVPDEEEGEYVMMNTERCPRKLLFTISSATSLENSTLQSNQVKFSMYSQNGDNLSGTSGAVLYFTVRASEELAEDSQISLIEGLIKGKNSQEASLSVSCAANVHNAAYVATIMNLTASSFSLTPTKDYDLTFSFEKNKSITAFQADIILPEGLSFVTNDDGEYVVFNEARLTSSHLPNYNLLNGNKTLRVMLSSGKNSPIKLDEGDFFTIKVKADAALAASSEITVNNMEFVQSASQVYHPADFTVAVSNPDIAAKAEADAALLQLNAAFEEVKKTIAGYVESVQTKLQSDIETVSQSITNLAEALALDVTNGDVLANASSRNASIEKVSTQIKELSENAAAAQKAYEEELAAAAANEAQYKADLAAIAEVQAQLDAAKKTVAGYAESVQASFAETVAALEKSVAELTVTAEASYKNGTSVADAAALKESAAAVVANIEKLLADAAAAQKAYEEDQEKAAANEAQYKADVAAIAEVQAQLDAAKKTVAGYAESVQASFAETVAALEKSVAELTVTAEASYKNGTSVADAAALKESAAAVVANIEKLLADAAAAQKAYEEDQEKAAANEAQYKAALAAIADVQSQLDAATKTVDEYAESVQASFAETIAALEASVAELTKTAETSYKNGTSVADAAALKEAAAAVVANIEKLLADAAAAQKAYEEEGGNAAANEAQHTADLAAVAEVQAKLNDVKTTIDGYHEDVQQAVAAQETAAQKAVDDLKAMADASYAAGTSVADKDKLQQEIEKVLLFIDKLAADAAAVAEELANENLVQYEADVAAINALKQELEDMESVVKTYVQSVQDAFAEDIDAIQQMIDKLIVTAETSFAAGTSVQDEAALRVNMAAVEKAIDEVAANAAAAQKAYVANERQHEADLDVVAGVQKNFDSVLEKIAGYDESVAQLVADDIQAIREAIEQLNETVETSYNNGTSVDDAESLLNKADEIEKFIIELEVKADEAQQNITTGIHNAILNGNEGIMYDMSGRQIKHAKGLVIIGKKKYMVK